MRKAAGPEALELCEQAFHLLRRAPVSALVLYYAGTLPFWLGFLFFWSDMSRDPFAESRVVEASLAMALLFLWMKCLQCLFADRLGAALAHAEPSWPPLMRFPRFIVSQLFLQGLSFIVVPVAALITLPLGWVLAYFQNVTVLGAGASAEGVRALHGRAVRMSALWPGQNHQVLFALLLFACVMALNLGVTVGLIPYALRTLTGTETVFTMAGPSMLNSTYFLCILALTHLCMDPVVKSVYLLRCFYGESMESAEDLRLELASLSRKEPVRRGAVAAIAAIVVLLGAGSPAVAEPLPQTVSSPSGSVSPPELERAFADVMQRREFRWRLPREMAPKVPQRDKGWLKSFIEDVASTLKELINSASRAVGRFWDWLMDKLWSRPKATPSTPQGTSIDWMSSLQGVGFLLLVFIAAVLAVWVFRVVRTRRAVAEEAMAASPVLIPDIAKEDVTADQLPEDGWIAMARELMESGELRLALRALYLASLATLARRGVLSVARYKSNVDYVKEVRRRSHSRPELVGAFSQNVALFDRSWYGTHEVTPDVITQVTTNLQTLQSGGGNA